ncbi:MAG TPA: carboxypeptidase regulatory-like domain-containing protein [Vicinamibacterales bacterium]
MLLALCAMFSAAPAFAQLEPAHLTGVVKDAQGAVLPGVTVTATSPALIGSEVAISEVNGAYRFASLPAGTYTLSFSLTGFQTQERKGIVLATGQTLTIDVQLALASLKENVTVTAESPVVDTQSTTVGSVLSTAKLVGVPTSTDVWGALAQTPGVRMRGYDVGGSHKMSQTGYDSFGMRGQNHVVMEGLDTTEGNSGDGNYMDYFTQSEMSVTAAGGDVAMQSPGAAIIYTVKSGGNQFKGLENITYEGSNFVGNNIDSATAARGFTGQPNLLFWEGHAELGGPVMKDKLWFYTAYNHFKLNKAISGVDQNVATQLALFNSYTAKLTYKASQKDTVVGFYNWNKKALPLRGLSATTPPESALAEYNPDWNIAGRYQRVWSNRLFSEFTFGTWGYDFPEVPSVDFRNQPPRLDTATGVSSGAGWGGGAGPFDLGWRRPQVNGQGTYFLPTKHGSHDFKMGFAWANDSTYDDSSGTSGAIYYLDRNNKPDEIRLTDVGDPATFGTAWTGPNDRDLRYALYFQDRWTVGQFTTTLGLRYDHQRPYYESAKSDPILSGIFQPTTTPGATLLSRGMLAPRAGVSWDPKGDSRSVVKAFYGRFYFNFATDFSNVDPGGSNTRDYVFNDLNNNGLYDGPQELGALVGSTGGNSTTLDPNIKTPYTDEVDLSYDHQFWGESSIRFAYVRKMTRDQYATYNVARAGQFTVPVTVPVTLQNYSANGAVTQGTQNFTVYDIPDALSGVVTNLVATMPAEVDNGAENYDTLDVAFNKRFQQGLFLDSSFDYGWRDELRTTSSSNSPSNTDPIGTGYFQNVFPTVPNRQKTTSWQAHLSGRYEFPLGIGFAANLRAQSGWPYARVISVKLPNVGTQKFLMTDLDQNYADAVTLIDLRLDKSVRVRTTRLTFMVDIFNLMNSNTVTNFNLANGSRYNQINATLDPRTVELGFRVEF